MNQPTVTALLTALARCTVNDPAATLGTAERIVVLGTSFCAVASTMLALVRATPVLVAEVFPAAMVSLPLREKTAGPTTRSAVFPDATTPVPEGLCPSTAGPPPEFAPCTAAAAALVAIPVTPGPPLPFSPSTPLPPEVWFTPCTPLLAPTPITPSLPPSPCTPMPCWLNPLTRRRQSWIQARRCRHRGSRRPPRRQ